ncbi:MAG TPA: serine protease [Rhabdochlamydiaceae bacterium]|jgi:S1-C subfamily serine protease|nr:serine protease [Rhabdochlamydiaceae bacterium]
MNKLFLTLLFFFASLKLEALHYPLFEGASLENHKNSTTISTQFLDKLTEDLVQSICMIMPEKSTDWSSWAKNLWNSVENNEGTAFFITPDGHFITNKATLQSQSSVLAFLPQKGILVKAQLIAEHPTANIALLKIDKPDDITLSYLTLTSDKEAVGSWIFSLLGRGVIDNKTLLSFPSIGKIMGYFKGYAVSSIACGEGNAGSPVLNMEGKVIGILSGGLIFKDLEGRSGMSGMLPIHQLKNWIEEALRTSGYVEPLKEKKSEHES